MSAQAIWKFPIRKDRSRVHMPKGAQLLAVQMQAGVPCLWAAVDLSAERVRRSIAVYGTGHTLMDELGAYIGTVQDGSLVWHFFDLGEVPA